MNNYKLYFFITLFGFFIICLILIFVLFGLDNYHNYCYLDLNDNLGYSSRCKNVYCDKVDYVVRVKDYIIIDK